MRNVIKVFFVITYACHININIAAHEYIYPVASLLYNNEKHFYLIHQTSTNHLDLLLWNPRTKETQKVLLSRFTPAGLQIIPGNKGFNFIDHDSLRVKMHHKRSPQLIDFSEPLYDLTVISWITETTFYFSARNNTMFGIYQASLQGHCDCILASNENDCLYPQKIHDMLFYIERDKEFIHKIVRTSYIPVSYQEIDPARYINCQRKTESIKHEYNDISKSIIVDVGKKSIAFLHMINESEGFFIEHPATITKNDTNITFLYHYIYRVNDDNIWKDTVLFNFTIPAYYLLHDNDSRVYESMLPFLPRYIPHYGFLFVDVLHDTLGLKFYNIIEKRIIFHLEPQENQSLFGIFVDDATMYYGGAVIQEDTLLPRIWLAHDGVLCVDLPRLEKADFVFT